MMATCRESGKVPLCGVGRKGNAAWDLRPCLQIYFILDGEEWEGKRGKEERERVFTFFKCAWLIVKLLGSGQGQGRISISDRRRISIDLPFDE